MWGVFVWKEKCNTSTAFYTKASHVRDATDYFIRGKNHET